MPDSQRRTGPGEKVRSVIHISAMIAAPMECVHNIRHGAVEREMAREMNQRFGLIGINAVDTPGQLHMK
jgi:hypothetical protein